MSPPMNNNGNLWDVNCSMRLPISMCGPYGADFDGDEMTLFPIKTQAAIKECVVMS